MSPIRVVVVEDHPAVRMGLCYTLEQARDIQVIGSASTGREALGLVRRLKPDVILLDIHLPGLNGLNLVRAVFQAQANVRILVLSAQDDQQFVDEVLRIGVMGYLSKDEALADIVEAVRRAFRGERGWIGKQMAARIYWRRRTQRRRQSSLALSQLQFLRLINNGRTIPEFGQN